MDKEVKQVPEANIQLEQYKERILKQIDAKSYNLYKIITDLFVQWVSSEKELNQTNIELNQSDKTINPFLRIKDVLNGWIESLDNEYYDYLDNNHLPIPKEVEKKVKPKESKYALLEPIKQVKFIKQGEILDGKENSKK